MYGGRLAGYALIAAVCLGLFLFAPTASAADPARIDAAIEDILSDKSYQTDLPGEADIEDSETEAEPWNFNFVLPPGFAQAFTWLLWIAGGGVLLVLITLVLQELGGLNLDFRFRRRVTAAAHVRVTASEAPSPMPEVGDAEEMARAGDFAGAVHALLLRAIDHLKQSARGNLAGSLTSREVLELPWLEEIHAQPLAELVRPVERSHFGGQMLERADYDAARQAYDVLTDQRRPA